MITLEQIEGIEKAMGRYGREQVTSAEIIMLIEAAKAYHNKSESDLLLVAEKAAQKTKKETGYKTSAAAFL